MLNPSRRPLIFSDPSRKAPRLLYQILLAPEALLIGLILLAHELSGKPVWTAALGALIVLLFLTRVGLLCGARFALSRADYPLARRLAQLALRLHPWSADGWSLRASVALNSGDSAGAEDALRAALSCFPGQASLHAALSGALLDQERVTAARQEALHALALDPAQPTALLHLAEIERLHNVPAGLIAGRLRQGLDASDDPRAQAPLRCILAELLIEQGQEDAAGAEIERAEGLLSACARPQRAALLFHLGALRRRLGDAERALSHFSAAEQLDPQGRYANSAWRAARL